MGFEQGNLLALRVVGYGSFPLSCYQVANRKDDKFLERWVKEPLKWGKKEICLQDYAKTRRIDEKGVEAMLDDYYAERGWDVKRGIPTKEKLAQLGLSDVAEDLGKRGLL